MDPLAAWPRSRLVAHAFLVLFLELSLIRWAGAQVVHLSYFTNFILLGSFLGIGVGFLRARSPRRLFTWAPLALGAFAVLVLVAATRIPERGVELLYLGGTPGNIGLPAWLVLPLIFLAVAGVMTLTAQGLAVAFARFDPLDAYRWDVVGSILGVVTVAVMAFLEVRPIVWGLVVVALFLSLSWPHWRLCLAGSAVVLAVLGIQSAAPNTYYSPYYLIEVKPQDVDGLIPLYLNSIPHQTMVPLSVAKFVLPQFVASEEDPVPKRVLIIGAGTGNDAAVALDRGAEHVDAVEIDPTLVRISKALHPDAIYDDPRVDVYVDDGRAFLSRSDETYDVILFALPDSVTLVTGQAGIRLESYLFTREAFEAAKAHLAPGGTFAFYGFFPTPWTQDRVATTIAEVWGRPACSPRELSETDGTVAPRLTMILSGSDACPYPFEPQTERLPSVTDDRPFPYIKGIEVPAFYWIALGLIALVSVIAVRIAGGPIRRLGGYLDLFFMGAAFLLLETKSVVQFALLFGTTWFVNALVFAGVLLVVLAGVEVSRRVRLKRPALLYPFLFLALGVAWMVPPAALLELPVVPRFAAAVVLAFTPIFLANVIFSQRFRDVEASTVAFAANLLGAMVGGVLEYAALIIGYRALLGVAALLYLCALIAGRKFLLARRAPPEPTGS